MGVTAPPEPLPEELVRVEARHFVAGLVMKRDLCVYAAPILAWTVGWHREELRAYFIRKGWKATRVASP